MFTPMLLKIMIKFSLWVSWVSLSWAREAWCVPWLATLLWGGVVGGEEWDLLAAHTGVHGVNGGDAGLGHCLGAVAGGGVDGHTVDV